MLEKTDPFYRLIAHYYEGKKAKRSGVPYIRHIDEGLAVLKLIKSDETVARAYCLHPLVQHDVSLLWVCATEEYDAAMKGKTWFESTFPWILAMEYRKVANAYLSTRRIKHVDEIDCGPLQVVKEMLTADKIQNRKDFELYHLDSHERADELVEYFAKWFLRLGITEKMYQDSLEVMATI